MIIDSFKNWKTYADVHPRLAKAFEYLSKADLASLAALPDGRNEIDGDEIFFMMHRRELKKQEEVFVEVHNRYMDIQFVMEGTESFGWKERSELRSPRGEFDAEKDMQLFDDAPSTLYSLHGGQFCIFFPQDGHAPLIGSGSVVKCLVKVLV